MTKTTNYQLNQWAKSDRVMMDDFNADNTKIDAALKANADAAAAASAAVALCGNCKIETSTYTGNGKYGSANPVTLTFPKKPTLIIVFRTFGEDGFLLMISNKTPSDTSALVRSNNGNYATWVQISPSWQGSTLQFYYSGYTENKPQWQGNASGVVYQVVAFYAQDK